MKLVRYVCNIVFIVILLLFTVGYSLQSIFNINAVANIVMPTTPNTQQISNDININYSYSLYVDKIIDTSNSPNITINYNDLNSTLGTVTNIIKNIFIVVSVCIGLVISLSVIGLKMISYIPLGISQLVLIMTSIFIIIMYSTTYLTNIIKNYINTQTLNGSQINISKLQINFDTGGLLILVSSALLIFINFIYVMLG